jgi:hypothetical protein
MRRKRAWRNLTGVRSLRQPGDRRPGGDSGAEAMGGLKNTGETGYVLPLVSSSRRIRPEGPGFQETADPDFGTMVATIQARKR